MGVDTAPVLTPQPGTSPGATGGRLRRAAAALGSAITGPVVVSVVVAFIIGGGVLAVAGADPVEAYRVMLRGSLTGPGLVNTFERAVPLVGMALALSIAFRAGVFNLGGEGQLVLGGLAGTVVALFAPGPGVLVMLLALVAAVVAGGLWGVLAAVLQTSLGVPILISSLLLSYPARYFSSYLVRFPLKEEGSSMVATEPVPPGTRLPVLIAADSGMGQWLSSALGDSVLVRLSSRLDWSLVVIVVLVAGVALFNRRTPAGFEAGLTGLNARFSRYAGVRTDRLTIASMFASGGLAGLVGVMLVLGSQIRLIDGALVQTNYAWTGLLVALLAASRPVGVAVAGTFFAAIVVGGEAMQREAGVSAQISQVILAVVIVLFAIRLQITWRRRRSGAAPADSDETGRV